MTQANPLGAVAIFDAGIPRTLTGKAREVISGGEFVFCSGADGVVSSGVSSYATTDVKVALCNHWGRCNGIALNNAGSNENVTFARQGDYLLRSAGAISGGGLIVLSSGASSYESIAPLGYAQGGSNVAGVIGRAITSAGSEEFLLASLNL